MPKISALPQATVLASTDFFPVVTGGITSLCRAGILSTFVCPENFGAKGDGATDDTTAIQNAIIAAPAGSVIFFGPHNYRFSALTVNKPLRLIGSGMQGATTLTTTSGTNDAITISTNLPCSVSDMTIQSAVTTTAGSFIKVGTNVVANGLSMFERLLISSPWIGINFVSADLFTVRDCYFPTYNSTGIQVQDTAAPDSGDSLIFNCTFDGGTSFSGTRIAIFQASGGGLRVIGNKFLNGSYHYLGQIGAAITTSVFIFEGNSSEGAANDNVSLNSSGGTFGKVSIHGNQFSVGNTGSTVGVRVGDPGFDYLDDLSIGNNDFNLATNAQSINLARCGRCSILPNIHVNNGTGTFGVSFGANNGPTVVHPQTMHSVVTRYTGTLTNVTFIPGGLVQTGTAISTVTNIAYGGVFISAANTLVFPTAFPKAPGIVSLKCTDVGSGAGVVLVDGSITASQFQYKAIGVTVAALPKIQWEASGG